LLTWTERILSLPVRTAAVAEFLRELAAKGWGDLNGVLATFNDGELCREALGYWLEREWIVRAPNSALTALTGPAFSRELTLQEFCGDEGDEWDEWDEPEGDVGEGGTVDSPPSAVEGAEEAVDENQ
jgi:hypothetical protein